MSISANGHLHDEANGGSDSDLESDFATAAAESGADHYHPIEPGSDSDSESDSDQPDPNPTYQNLTESNGNHISSLDLNSTEPNSDSDSEPEPESESERESESEQVESGRENGGRLELSEERRERIREAMRGVEFLGAVPGWVEEVPEEQWVDRLRRIRGETDGLTGLTLTPPDSSS